MENGNNIWSSLIHTPECLDKHRKSRFNEDVRDRLIELLRIETPSDLIEIGCGPGTLSNRLHQWCPGLQITAFDMDKAFIDYAASHYQGPNYICGDARNFVSEKTFDYVLSHTIMEYMDEKCFFDINRRLLKPDGISIIISTVKSINYDNYLLYPQIDELYGFLKFCETDNTNRAVDQVLQKQNIDYSEFLDRFKRNGFEILSQNFICSEVVPQNYSIERIQDTIEMYREIQLSTFKTAWNRTSNIPESFSYSRILQSIEDYYLNISNGNLLKWPATVDILRITRARLASAHSNV